MWISTARTLIDEISDAETVAERVPRLARHFTNLEDVRTALAEASVSRTGIETRGMTRGGTMLRLANIPISVWSAIHQVDPEIFLRRDRFRHWLEKHPEYKTAKQVIRA